MRQEIRGREEEGAEERWITDAAGKEMRGGDVDTGEREESCADEDL